MSIGAPERLAPSRAHHAYYVLVALARVIDEAAAVIEPGATVLDYGCGDQPYRPLIEGRGGHYLGADVNGVPGADVEIGPEGDLPLGDSSVAVVLSTQVLEHVPEPAKYLSEARRVLRPGGVLLLTTHGVWPYHPHPDDFWRWTAAGLHRLLTTQGYHVQRVTGVLGAAGAGIQLWQDSLLRMVPPWLHLPLILATQPVIALHDRWTNAAERDKDAAVLLAVACTDAKERKDA